MKTKVKNLEYKKDFFLSYVEYGEANAYPIFVFHGLIASIKENFLIKDFHLKGVRLIIIARPGYGDSSFLQRENYLQSLEYMDILLETLILISLVFLAYQQEHHMPML